MKYILAKALVGLVAADGVLAQARAQLAITEVMAQGALNCGTPDYWELTNFGSENIDLNGYNFTDDGGTGPFLLNPFANLAIRAGQSVIFFRSQPGRVIMTPEDFINWWGAANLPPTLQEVRAYDNPGLSGQAGDEVWLLDGSGRVVDMVEFGPSTYGHSFVYNPQTGIFGDDISVRGVGGAIEAAWCIKDVSPGQDVGSPGRTTGMVPLSIIEQPMDQEVDPGADVSFAILAGGMPRPHYQWTYNGAEIAGATASSLTISNVQPANAGAFHVLVNNGLTNLATRAATLSVNTNCTCAHMLRAPSDITLYLGQTAAFSVLARGYPPPRYQWSSNSAAIIGATNRTLVIPDATFAMSGTVYTVQVSSGSSARCPSRGCLPINASGVLTVTRRPLLQITEVMAAPTLEEKLIHNDWFELTNGDTDAVNLQGYKFRDSATLKAFNNAFVITNALVLQPGKSAIFVKDMSPSQFSFWWGRENLPPGLQICTFSGFSLNNFGEVIYLWNPAASNPIDAVATAGFPASCMGISIEFTQFCDDSGCTTDLASDSMVGANGAFHSVEDGDIGSPGYIANPAPRVLRLWRSNSIMNLKCRVIEGKPNRLSFKDRLSAAMWTPLATNVATNSIMTLQDDTVGGAASRFYRLEALP